MLSSTLLIISATLLAQINIARSCNEAVCASIVTKCLLTEKCNCNYKDCTCCKECNSCLGPAFFECCDCLDMCPKQNDTLTDKQSTVEDFHGVVTNMFNVLTEEPDKDGQWKIYNFPIFYDKTQFSPGNPEYTLQMQSSDLGSEPLPSLNCTVAYIRGCMSTYKCRRHCATMGASSMRWFYNGCCECNGPTCINYGFNRAMCEKCSSAYDEEENEIDLEDEENYVWDDTDDNDLN